MENPETKPASGGGCLLRLYWMFLGNVVLLFLFAFILKKHFTFPSLLDAGYWATVISLIAARHFDIRYMKGETAEGKPASPNDFRRYSIMLFIVSVLIWSIGWIIR